MSVYIIPIIIGFIVFWGLIKGVKVFDEFVKGAKNGIKTTIKIMPTMVGIVFAITMFTKSNSMQFFENVFFFLPQTLGLDRALLPIMILRPISGSGATSVFMTIISKFGTESLITKTAAIMMGSSETTFYTISVYYGSNGISKTRHTVISALTADLTAFFAAGFFARLFLK